MPGPAVVSPHPEAQGKIKPLKRHGFSTRFVHWAVAVSTIVLVLSGLGQLPLFHRYMVDELPYPGWTSDFNITLLIHYSAAMLLAFAAIYHAVVHTLRREFSIVPRRGDFKESYLIMKAMMGRGEEPASHKYLAEQRLAYAFIGANLLLLLITGYIKVLKNLAEVHFSYETLWINTQLHNLATALLIIGVLGHLAAFLFKANRPLLPSLFHGHVDAEYARDRHCLWCEEIDDE